MVFHNQSFSCPLCVSFFHSLGTSSSFPSHTRCFSHFICHSLSLARYLFLPRGVSLPNLPSLFFASHIQGSHCSIYTSVSEGERSIERGEIDRGRTKTGLFETRTSASERGDINTKSPRCRERKWKRKIQEQKSFGERSVLSRLLCCLPLR